MSLVPALTAVLSETPADLARAALVVARVEQPDLDETPSLRRLDELGRRATARLSAAGSATRARVAALNTLLFEDEAFTANRTHYDDYRNSLLNVVLERRSGIPITLALVYMEVAQRAGLRVEGVAFPGHFLMRVPAVDGDRADLILDPFDSGAELSDADCRRLLARHMGNISPLGDEGAFDPSLLRACTPKTMLTRMLNNLKRAYVDMRSFTHARAVTELILAVDPTLLSELRDRALLAYHLDDFPSALRDLEDYRRLNAWTDDSDPEERERLWEHVKNLKRRVASLN